MPKVSTFGTGLVHSESCLLWASVMAYALQTLAHDPVVKTAPAGPKSRGVVHGAVAEGRLGKTCGGGGRATVEVAGQLRWLNWRAARGQRSRRAPHTGCRRPSVTSWPNAVLNILHVISCPISEPASAAQKSRWGLALRRPANQPRSPWSYRRESRCSLPRGGSLVSVR